MILCPLTKKKPRNGPRRAIKQKVRPFIRRNSKHSVVYPVTWILVEFAKSLAIAFSARWHNPRHRLTPENNRCCERKKGRRNRRGKKNGIARKRKRKIIQRTRWNAEKRDSARVFIRD